MKDKILKLKNFGFDSKTLSSLSESQINHLYSRLIVEQSTPGVTTTKVTKDVTTVGDSALSAGARVNVDGKQKTVKKVPGGVQIEGDMTEEKKDESKPFKVCNAQIAKLAGTSKRSEWSKEHLEKYKKCAENLKESLSNKNKDVTLQLENKIMELVKYHIPPRMTKSELIKYITESNPAVAPTKPKPSTRPTIGKPNSGINPRPNIKPATQAKSKEVSESPEVAPSKPKTSPGTKEPPKPTKKPSHPGKDPHPGVKEAPRATNPAVAPTKPKTSPGTKEPPKPTKKPSHPGKDPHPGVKEAPRAGQISPDEAKEKIIDTIMKILNDEQN